MLLRNGFLGLALGLSLISGISPARAQAPSLKEYYLKLSADRDPAIRIQAIHALRAFVSDTEVLDRVVRVLLTSFELENVRTEAAKSLSVSDDSSAIDALLEIGNSSYSTPYLRLTSLKALYRSAQSRGNVRSQLIGLLGNSFSGLEGQEGSAWALFASAGDSDTADALLRVAKNSYYAEAVRVEAMKSLFSAVSSEEVRKGVFEVARNAYESVPVRITAILCLQPVRDEADVRDLLKQLIENAFTLPQLRSAAVEAQAPVLSDSRIRFFHLARYGSIIRDPLEE